MPTLVAALVVARGSTTQAEWAVGQIGLATQPVALSLIAGPIAIVVALMTLGKGAFSGRFRLYAHPAAAAIGIYVAALCTAGAIQDRSTAASLPAVYLATIVETSLSVAVGTHALDSLEQRRRRVTGILEDSGRAIAFLQPSVEKAGSLRRFALALVFYASCAASIGVLVMHWISAPTFKLSDWAFFLLLAAAAGVGAAGTGNGAFVAFDSYATSRRSARDRAAAIFVFFVGSAPALVPTAILVLTPTVRWLAVPFFSAWLVPVLSTAPGLLTGRRFRFTLSNAVFDLTYSREQQRFRKAETELNALSQLNTAPTLVPPVQGGRSSRLQLGSRLRGKVSWARARATGGVKRLVRGRPRRTPKAPRSPGT